jgi:hypothetical protein
MKYQVEALIKTEIESVFGRSIVSSRDCIQLSYDVYEKTRCQLNPNTLRRFFGLVKANYPPSYSTLTILSKYCGFQTVDEVAALKKEDTASDTPDQESVLHYMVSLFRDVNVKDENDDTFLGVVVNTLSFLNHHPALADKFQSQIAKTRNGQTFYFEQFVNIDKLNQFYGDGLRYYYAEKQTVSAQVFAHSLLTFRYWLTGNEEMVSKQAAIVEEQAVNNDTEPFIWGRYFASMLYNANVKQTSTEDIILDAFKYHAAIPGNYNGLSFPRFESYMAEALVLTGHNEEGLYYIDYAIEHYDDKQDDSGRKKFIQYFNLLKAIALSRKGRYTEATELFNKISPIDFYFLRKKFSNILYLLLNEKLKRQHPKQEQQLTALLQETGYYRLQAIY